MAIRKEPLTKEDALDAHPLIEIRAWQTVAKVDHPGGVWSAIRNWWDEPSQDGEPVASLLEWEMDGHKFELNITPL